MTALEVLEAKREEKGIPISELARRTNVKYSTLQRALSGIGSLKGDDFVRVCKELEVEIVDFH